MLDDVKMEFRPYVVKYLISTYHMAYITVLWPLSLILIPMVILSLLHHRSLSLNLIHLHSINNIENLPHFNFCIFWYLC